MLRKLDVVERPVNLSLNAKVLDTARERLPMARYHRFMRHDDAGARSDGPF